MAKTFISFLGTNDYVPCVYHPSNNPEKICKTPFIQEATLRLFVKPSSPDDFVVIFLTDDARTSNWNDREGRKGLKSILNGMKNEIDCDFTMHEVDIPDITDENDIWAIFDSLKDSIPENCEIFFDITHSFRSIPMLGIVLINYLRLLKNVSLRGIYYGAVEKLGRIDRVRQMDEDKRLAPVIDLTPFDYIMRFSFAAGDFVNYGISGSLESVLMERANPVLNKTRGGDKPAKEVENFTKNLNAVTLSIATNRGIDIYKGEIFNNLKTSIEILRHIETGREFKALVPLFEKIENKINDFEQDDIINGIKAVKWCIDHSLVQQGITLLHETILTIVCSLNNIDFTCREWREFTSSALHFISRKEPFEKFKIKDFDPELARAMWEKLSAVEIRPFAKMYESLSGTRNSINHGGMNTMDKKEPNKLINKLRKVYDEVSLLLVERGL